MAIRPIQGNRATINNVLDRLLTDQAFCEAFERDPRATLQTLALNTEDFDALMLLDYTELLAAAKTMREIRADCVRV